MNNRFFTQVCVIGCLLVLVINGCGSDSDDQTDEPANGLPRVTKLILPDIFTPGETIELQIIAHDPDDDPLSYTWHVTAGTLDSTTQAKVKWTTPADVRAVTITVRVHDSPTSSIKRTKIVNYVVDRPPEKPSIRIIPGRQGAGIKLGDPFETVKVFYGEPDDPINRVGFFSYWDPDIGLAGFVDRNIRDRPVRSLSIDEPNKAKTVGGTGVGSSREHVEDEFGPAEEVQPGRKHWYWKRGIQFTYDDAFEVESIYIFKPIGAAPPNVALFLKREHLQKIEKNALYRKLRRKADTFSQ